MIPFCLVLLPLSSLDVCSLRNNSSTVKSFLNALRLSVVRTDTLVALVSDFGLDRLFFVPPNTPSRLTLVVLDSSLSVVPDLVYPERLVTLLDPK